MDIFTQRLRLAADYMTEHGWVQGAERENGRVCLTGAIRYCAPQTGDEYVIRAVLRSRGTAEDWNDEESRTESEVAGLLRTMEVTDEDLSATFGPQWREIVTLVRQAGSLTSGQAESISAAVNAAVNAAWNAAWSAAWNAAGNAAGNAARNAAWNAAGTAAWSAAGTAARNAAWTAAGALGVRDLISSEHFATLYGPWAPVFGEPSPCDL